jgi:glycopeptide antibiotics resistance protein
MQLSTKYALVGMGALFALTIVDWTRSRVFELPKDLQWFLGVLPNLAAVVAISFVLMSIWIDRRPSEMIAVLRGRFALFVSFSALGLVLWEFLQRSSRSLVFDIGDLAATCLGVWIAWMLFSRITPKKGLDAGNREDH